MCNKKKNNGIEYGKFIAEAEYFMVGIIATLVVLYFFIILIIFVNKKYNWPNNNFIFWTLVVFASLLALVAGIFARLGIKKIIGWLTIKLNALMYHFEKRSQFLIGIFLIIFAVAIVKYPLIFFPTNKFFNTDWKNIYSFLIGISGGILSFLSIFNMNKILFYQLTINYELTKKGKVQIWATNTGSEDAAYRFEGLYAKNTIDEINKKYAQDDMWIFWKNIKNVSPTWSNKSIQFQNLDKGYATKVVTILKEDISKLKDQNYYIIYSKSTGEIIRKQVSKKDLLKK